jgi:intracellular sulfur oxidation DsrE/DsrF family protein
MQSESTQVCTIETGSVTCNWDDKGCHSIWYAQRNMRLFGYLARVCEKQVPAGKCPKRSLFDGSQLLSEGLQRGAADQQIGWMWCAV